MTIWVEKIPRSYQLDDFMDRLIKNKHNDHMDHTVIDKGFKQIGSYEFGYVKFASVYQELYQLAPELNRVTLNSIYYFTIKLGRVYIIKYVALPDIYDKFLPEFEESLKTFKITE